MTTFTPTWAAVTALDAVRADVALLHDLARDYMTEADITFDPATRAACIDTAHRLAAIADGALGRVIVDPSHADVVSSFVFAGRLQLEHVQSARRFRSARAT